MSLLEEYEALSSLTGFTLGFYKFFEAFQFTEGGNFKWNEIIMWQGVKSRISETEWDWFPSTYCVPYRYSEIRDIVNFAEFQKTWIRNTPKTARRALKEECQRRINFFVAALHKLWAGKSVGGTNKTWDPCLRDIRHMAFLCLKE